MTIVFVGVQPVLMHVPPRCSFSIRATDHPLSASLCASGFPAWPDPITIASYFIQLSDVITRSGGAAKSGFLEVSRTCRDGPPGRLYGASTFSEILAKKTRIFG